MLVLEKEKGDVITVPTAGLETGISLVETTSRKFKLAIDAPAKTRPVKHAPEMAVDDILEQELRANYRQELLMF